MDHYYGTVEGFREYHTERGRDVSQYTDAAILPQMLVASEWIDAVYFSSRWRYMPATGSTQIRRWPAIGVYDIFGYMVPSDTVPQRVEYATYEAALRELQSTGALTSDYTPGPYKRIAIEGAISVEYRDREATDAQTRFLIIDRLLEPLLWRDSQFSSYSGATGRA